MLGTEANQRCRGRSSHVASDMLRYILQVTSGHIRSQPRPPTGGPPYHVGAEKNEQKTGRYIMDPVFR